MFQLIPKVYDAVKVRALCRPVKFFHTDLDKPFLYVPHFLHGGIFRLKQERDFPKLLPQLEAQNRLKCHCMLSSGPNHEKQPQTIIPSPHNFTIGTMLLGR